MKSKVLALTVAIILVFSLAVSAFAVTVTVDTNLSGHSFKAYQIFTGTESETANQLSNIKWGDGISVVNFITALKGNTTLATDFASVTAESTDASATAVAAVLETISTDSAKVRIVENIAYQNIVADKGTAISSSTTSITSGYYLIVDETTMTDGDAYNAALLEVTGSEISIELKTDKPTLTQKIWHDDKSGTGAWDDDADNKIGDTVKFKTESKIPDISDYLEYPEYVINIKLSDGFSSNVENGDDSTVSIKDQDGNVISADYYSVEVIDNPDGTTTIKIKVDVEKAIEDDVLDPDDTITTEFSAVLNEDAEPGTPETSVAFLSYSDNPEDSTSKGETADDTVYDWTFKVSVNKYANISGVKTTFTTDKAKFVLSESSSLAVSSMNVDANGAPATTTSLVAFVLDNSKYVVATPEQIADNSVTKVYAIDAGEVDIVGLNDNTTYYLYETKSPSGYNILNEAVSFKLTATYDGVDPSKVPTVALTVGTETATKVEIENKAGSVLPETGGIGTTIFYVVGGLLVVGAGAVLITKKRMG